MKQLYIKFPSKEDYAVANKIFTKAYNYFISVGLLPKEEFPFYLKKFGIFTTEHENELDLLEAKDEIMYPRLPPFKDNNAENRYIENYMIEIIRGYRVFNPADVFIEKEEIEKTKNEIRYDELRVLKNTQLKHSADALAEQVKLNYLTYCCIYKNPDERLWSSYKEFLSEKRDIVVKAVQTKLAEFLGGVPTTVIRRIARHPLWRTRWIGATKTGAPLFNGVISDWDTNKLFLVYWSNFYDSVYGGYKTPDKFIVDDDRLLDAWLEAEYKKDDSSSSTANSDKDGVRGVFKTRVAPIKKKR